MNDQSPRYIQGLNVHFLCNICSQKNDVPLEELTRETPTCSGCGSSVRYRSLMHQLSLALFEMPLALRDFPLSKEIRGLGTSDWEPFAKQLAQKLCYINTYYDSDPFLDLKKPSEDWHGKHDFVICSEVLEHIDPPVQRAFEGLFSLLRPGGVAILTVPFQIDAETVEHFPELHQWALCPLGDRMILVNTTKKGTLQVFDNLTFHGGRGSTLEMRIFGENDFLAGLQNSGFETHVVREAYLDFGIHWAVNWSLPVIARRPLDA